MSALERLQAARAAAKAGRHEEALREHIWLHNHALETEPTFAGVRLSFALADWIRLGKAYPQALQTLIAIRDQKTEALLAGNRDRGWFHDVDSINERFDEGHLTDDLFRRLLDLDEDFASSCAPIALDGLARRHNYELAARFLPDLEEHVNQLAAMLHEQNERSASRPEPRHVESKQRAHAELYADEVATFLDILQGVGRQQEAGRIRSLALRLAATDAARATIEERWRRRVT